MITLRVITPIAIPLRVRINFEKEKIFCKKIFSIEEGRAPDGVEAQVCEVVHEVDVEVDEVDPDVHVGCDLPMSIYLQPIIVITLV